MKVIIGSLSFIFLTSCSLLPPEAPAAKSYILIDPVSHKINKNISQKILYVSTINSVPWLESNKMAYQLDSTQINYFAKNQWAASPSELLQPIIIHALQNSGNYRAVISGQGDQELNLMLLAMQQDFSHKPSDYKIILQATLSSSEKILGSKRFEITTTAPSDNPEGGANAANHAVAKLLPQLIQFVHAKSNA